MNDGAHSDGLTAALTRADQLDRHGHELAMRHDLGAAATAWAETAGVLRTSLWDMVLWLAEVLERTAVAHAKAGQAEAGMLFAKEAITHLRAARAAGGAPAAQLALRLGGVGQLFCVLRRWDAAADILAEADGWFASAPTAKSRSAHLQLLDMLATAHRFAGRPTQAIAVLERALESPQPGAGAVEERLEAARLRNTLGQILVETGDPAAAVPALAQCVAEAEALAAAMPAPPIRNLLAAALNRLGHAHAALRERDDALSCLEQSVAIMRVLVEDDGITALADDLETAQKDLQRLASGSDA